MTTANKTINERHKKLLSLLEIRGELDIAVLLKELKVSEATIRRDLAALEKAGEIVRTFGGARISRKSSLVIQTFEEKRKRLRKEKELIAQVAIKLVEPGMTIALDSGTTTWRVAANLKDKVPLTILTNALAVVEEVGSVEGISLHLSGGKFSLPNLDFSGQSVVSTFAEFHADIAFIAADSYIPGKGAFCLGENSAVAASAIANCADKRVMLVDHTKINARGYRKLLSNTQIDYLITDFGLDHKIHQALMAEPYKLIIAGEKE